MQLENAIKDLKVSLEELLRHRASLNDSRTAYEFRTIKVGADRLQAQLWWVNVPSPVAPEFLWDYSDIDLREDLPDVLSQLQTIAPLAVGNAEVETIKRNYNAAWPMLDIHPQRFRAMHALGKVLASEVRGGVGFAPEILDTALHTLMTNQRAKGQCLRYRIQSKGTRAFGDIAQLGAFYADFHSSGRNIFKFPQALVRMFARTDVEDISLESIQFPYRTMYLAFGPQPDLEVEPGWVVDGAYVNYVANGKAVQFAMTCAPTDPAAYAYCNERYEPTFIQTMTEQQMKLGIGEAADMVFAEKIAELRRQVEGEREMPDVFPDVKDATSEYAQQEIESIPKKYEAWKHALRLVINGLAYISTYPDDIDTQWPEGTPQSLLLKTRDGAHKQKRKAESELASMGYTEIRLCGRSVRNYANSSTTANSESLSRKATWVRGHWVRQPYGAGRALRRLQWRKPVLRNADAQQNEVDELGHIYQVEGQNSAP